jgi:TetR/AcrR family transcriptional regulator
LHRNYAPIIISDFKTLAGNTFDMAIPRAAQTQRRTRIQEEKEELILEAALEVFSQRGFHGSTIDQIAEVAGMSKPNLLYYFRTKDAMHRALIDRVLENWLEPLQAFNAEGDPEQEIKSYIRRKLEMAREFPRESRLFANEILQGAPHIMAVLEGPLKELVDEKADVIRAWIASGKVRDCDPHHMIFSIWSTTQHYADFDVQVKAVLGAGRDDAERFEEAARFLEGLFVSGLIVKPVVSP